jgi:hypothetical protein
LLRSETPEYDIAYRYHKLCSGIKDLEEENDILVLPSVDREHLIYLRELKAKIEAEEIGEVINK